MPTPILVQPAAAEAMNVLPALVTAMNQAATAMTLRERLQLARSCVAGRLVFTTSFGLEDQVIADALLAADQSCDQCEEQALTIALVTLDTGRLFPETYEVWAATEQRYGTRIPAILPDGAGVSRLIAAMGVNGFYDAVENRHACCGVRKVEPLGRALAGAAGWVTGLRSEQSAARDGVTFASVDGARQLVKISPLFDWPRERLLAEVERRAIPVNALHGRGFASIGCAPCTRALQPGEPERAGRWWWESEAAKECGLHVDASGRLVRALSEAAS